MACALENLRIPPEKNKIWSSEQKTELSKHSAEASRVKAKPRENAGVCPQSVLGKLLEDARHLTPYTTQLWSWGSQLGRRLLSKSGQALNAEPCGTGETYNLGPELQAALEECASQGLPAVLASHCSQASNYCSTQTLHTSLPLQLRGFAVYFYPY